MTPLLKQERVRIMKKGRKRIKVSLEIIWNFKKEKIHIKVKSPLRGEKNQMKMNNFILRSNLNYSFLENWKKIF